MKEQWQFTRQFQLIKENGRFVRFWVGDFISSLGNSMTIIALPFYILSLTGSASLMGAAVAVQWLPALFVRLIAGVYVDRVDRKRLLIGVSLLQALAVGSLTLFHGLAAIYAVIFIMGMLQQVVFPALFAVIPQIVNRDGLVSANALFSSSRTLSQIFGAPIAGAIVSLLGPYWAFRVDALTFLFLAALLTTLPAMPAQASSVRHRLWSDLKEGLLFAATDPVVRAICLLGLLSMFTSSTVGLATVLLTKRVWGVGALGYGMLSTVLAFGALLGSMIVGGLKRVSGSRLVVGSVLGQGLSILLLGLFPVYYIAFPLRFIMGAAGPLWNVPLDAYLQSNVAPDMLGRVYGATGISVSLGVVLAGTVGGEAGQLLGGARTLLLAGVILLVGLAFLARPFVILDKKAGNSHDEADCAANG